MPDQLTNPAVGPDAMFSTDLAPSRGQWHAIAVTALTLLQAQQPTNRLEATVMLTRLQLASMDPTVCPPPLPTVDLGF